jgi:hypothetical protein
MHKVNKKRGKAIPVTGGKGPLGCEMSRLPHFLDSSQMAVRLSALHNIILYDVFLSFPYLLIYLFYDVFIDAISRLDYSIQMIGWIMNSQGCGRKWLWPNLTYYTAIYLEWLKKTR